MPEVKDGFCPLTLQIILSTLPQQQEKGFHQSIKFFFDNYRKNAMLYSREENDDYWTRGSQGKKEPILYNPLSFVMLGNYDVAYISLIDQFKFAQKLVEPLDEDTSSSHTFQSYTGICEHDENDLRQFFGKELNKENQSRKYFVGICNVKLNNGLLIGNGKRLLELVSRQIENKIQDINLRKRGKVEDRIDFFILQTFSWFEFSVVIFTNEPDDVSQLMTAIRRMKLKHLGDQSPVVLNSSLYKLFYENTSDEALSELDLVADTHTYVGFQADLVMLPESDPYLINFLEVCGKKKLKTDIEWQIKPGHLHMLRFILESSPFSEIFEKQKAYLLAGKSDYLINQSVQRISSNVQLIRLILAGNTEIYQHVRKVKTRVQFTKPDSDNIAPTKREVFSLMPILGKLAIPNQVITNADRQLKTLKISRQIRLKLIKVFSNFNNGIQDAILFPYFLDFKVFIDDLILKIDKDSKTEQISEELRKEGWGVHNLEEIYMGLVATFQEGYNLRMLNCYQFEDITDFDIDFNSSIQQLLTAYGTLAMETGNLFFKADKQYTYCPIIQLHLSDTIANFVSINYYIHHLTSPEFVFATLVKEILNQKDYSGMSISNDINQLYREEYIKLKDYAETAELYDMIESGIIDLDYHIIDMAKFVTSFDLNFELFNYWSWMYNLQNSALYDSTGLMNQDHFRKELFRILFVSHYFGVGGNIVNQCPLPELETFWDRHFIHLEGQVNKYIQFLKKTGIATKLDGLILQLFVHTNDILANRLPIASDLDFQARGKVAILLRLNGGETHGTPGSYYKKINQFNTYEGVKVYESTGEQDDLVYMQFRMLQHLKYVWSVNKPIALLNRNWEQGNPLLSFIKSAEKERAYYADQTGGLFFSDIKSMNEYFKVNAKILSEILDFGMVSKKRFIKFKIMQSHEPK